jgi:hypothetical protein
VTPKMLDAMKALCRSLSHHQNLPQKTALALKNEGLVEATRMPTDHSAMPFYLCKLTQKGQAFCEERFGPVSGQTHLPTALARPSEKSKP